MIRYGVAGFGLHAVKRLMPGFITAKRSRVVALSRRDLTKGRADARRFDIDHVFTSTEELCQCADVDAVFVTSPNAMHLADVLTAIRYGKPVLCEKPMAMNVAEAEQMTAAAEQSNILLGIAQCFRFEESVRRIRESVKRQEIGRVLLIRSDFTFPGVGSPRRWLHDASLSGGGPIADIGVHCIDAMRYILGDEPERVFAKTASDPHSGSVEASAQLTLTFSGGAVGSSFVSFRAPYQTPIAIMGTEGTTYAHDGLTVDHPVVIERRKGGSVVTEEVSNADIYARQVDAFSSAIEDGIPFSVPAAEGLQNQRILDALYRSANSGCEEKIVSGL
jgi:predicted dehydrogenase